MSRYGIFALAALVACSGPDDKGGTGDTGNGTACPGGPFTGPVAITDYSAECDANGTLRYFVETEGWTANGKVFSQETSNENAWADEHDLVSYEFDECQAWDRLEAEVSTGATVDEATPNVSTVFTCDAHINDPDVMSYAALVYDLDGSVADCIAWGDDPEGLLDGTASGGLRTMDPSAEYAGCRVATAR